MSGSIRGSRLGIGRGPVRVVGGVLAVVVSVVLAVGVSAQGAGVCYVGLVVEPGGSCSYPGTDVEFRVDDSGSGSLLFFSSGQRLELRATSINGVEYTFVASRQSGGGWLVEEVGGSAATGPTSTPTTAPAATGVDASGGFSDVEGSTHEMAVGALAADGVFDGTECGPARFCPTDAVQRWVMAVWLVRILDGADPVGVGSSRFADVDESEWWAPYVERLADLGVTDGCATEPARFCPTETVTRARMASFLVRALDLPGAPSAGFADVEGGVHAANIDALAASGVTSGCRTGPLRYCPSRATTRAQMATFLTRALNMGEAPGSGLGLSAQMCRPSGIDGTQTGFPLGDWALPSTGTLRLGVLFMDFDDAEAEYSTRDEWDENFSLLEEYIETNSYGALDVEAFVPLHRWLRARGSHAGWVEKAEGIMGVGATDAELHSALQALLFEEAVRLAGSRFDVSGVDAVMVVYPSQHFFGGYAGSGSVGVSVFSKDANPNFRASRPSRWAQVAAHEMMHLFGLADLYHPDGPFYGIDEDAPVPPEHIWVAPRTGLMGLYYNLATHERDEGLHFFENGGWWPSPNNLPEALEMLAWSRWQLGWLKAGDVACITAPDVTIRLDPVAVRGQGTAMAVIPLSDTEVVVVESRRKTGYDDDSRKLHYVSFAYEWGKGVGLPIEGVFVYTVDTQVPTSQLPIRVAGDNGDGIVDRWPIYTEGETVTLRGYDISVVSSTPDGDTVRVRRRGPSDPTDPPPDTAKPPKLVPLPEKPVSGTVNAPDGTYTAVTAGAAHSCGLHTDGTIACWGNNRYGNTDAPDGAYTAIATRSAHSCGLRTDGTIVCWGSNSDGKTDAPDGAYTAVTVGLNYSCGLRTDGTIACWGNNRYGKADAPDGAYTAVATSFFHSCGLRTDGTIACWGSNDYGQLNKPDGTFTAITSGSTHSCGLRTDGTIACWGNNYSGQTDAPDGTYTAIAASWNHFCGLRTDGAIMCWGSNQHGETDAPDGTFTAVAAGWAHSCGLRTDGTIVCWGSNDYGQTDVPDGTFTAVAAGSAHSCGLRTDGTIVCWGDISTGTG